jgi:alanine racemase
MTDRDSQFPGNASWLELDAASLRHNAAVFRGLVGPEVSLGAVLKGNAYGHGFVETLSVVHAVVDVLYVITPQDALAVRAWERENGLAPRQVLVLGTIVAEEAVACARAGVDVAVADVEFAGCIPALRAAELGRPLRVHVHVDTGLGREGFTLTQVPETTRFLRVAPELLRVAGVLSHFANTEDVTEQDYARLQMDQLEAAEVRLRASLELVGPLQRHLAASAAAMLLPRARYDAVRVGIGLYGLWPSSETRLSARVVLGELPVLRPALRWRCRSQVVKWLPAGSYVGYGCTYRCSQDTRVAVLPVGYFDGYPRLLSSRAHVLVDGQRCPVLGRVMMNHLVVDVTRARQDESPLTATLLGADGDEHVSADLLATWAQTIHYEVVTRIGAHLRRRVVGR